MKRKYLDDIGITNRPDEYTSTNGADKKWAEQREIYGFDVRETWNMDVSFYCWLYERLMMYLEVCDIDLTYREFEYKDEILTHKQCIDKMLEGCKIALTSNAFDITQNDNLAKVEDVAKLWGLVCQHTWW